MSVPPLSLNLPREGAPGGDHGSGKKELKFMSLWERLREMAVEEDEREEPPTIHRSGTSKRSSTILSGAASPCRTPLTRDSSDGESAPPPPHSQTDEKPVSSSSGTGTAPTSTARSPKKPAPPLSRNFNAFHISLGNLSVGESDSGLGPEISDRQDRGQMISLLEVIQVPSKFPEAGLSPKISLSPITTEWDPNSDMNDLNLEVVTNHLLSSGALRPSTKKMAGKVCKNSFSGKDLVSSIIMVDYASERQESVMICQRLLDAGIIVPHILIEIPTFSDSSQLYSVEKSLKYKKPKSPMYPKSPKSPKEAPKEISRLGARLSTLDSLGFQSTPKRRSIGSWLPRKSKEREKEKDKRSSPLRTRAKSKEKTEKPEPATSSSPRTTFLQLVSEAKDDVPSTPDRVYEYTIETLMDALVGPDSSESLQTETLFTYHSFCSSKMLFETLLLRFRNARGATAEATHLKICGFMREWATLFPDIWESPPPGSPPRGFLERTPSTCFEDKTSSTPDSLAFSESVNLDDGFFPLTVLQTFFSEVEHELSFTSSLKALSTLIYDLEHPVSQDTFRNAPPAPFSSFLTGEKMTLLLIEPLELARQMTLIDSDLFNKIQRHEFLGLKWMKDDKQKVAPNIYRSIVRFNITSRWVGAEILREETVENRVAVLKHFLQTAKCLVELRNFNGLLQILSALHGFAVLRLKKTFAALASPERLLYEHLLSVIDSSGNFRNLGVLMKAAEDEPCVPYLGMFLTKLSSLHEINSRLVRKGNPKREGDEALDLLNWQYNISCTGVLQLLHQYQKIPYELRVLPLVKDYILNATVFDDEVMEKLSRYVEPREGAGKPLVRPPQLRRSAMVSFVPQTKKNPKNKVPVESKALKRSYMSSGNSKQQMSYGELFSRLCSPELDINFMSELLMAYRSILSADDLLLGILEKYRSHDNLKVKSSCLRIIRLWIEGHWKDYLHDNEVLTPILEDAFQYTHSVPELREFLPILRDILKMVLQFMYKSPTPVVSKIGLSGLVPESVTSDILSFSATHIAQQLTLFEQSLFFQINPWELMGKSWTRSSKRHDAPNVVAILQHSKIITGWVQSTLFLQVDLARRRAVLKQFIEVMKSLSELHNYQTLASVVAGLASPMVMKLEKTFSALSKGDKKAFQACQEIVSPANDFHILKHFQSLNSPPCLPLLAMHMQEIQRLEEKYPTAVSEEFFINRPRLKHLGDLLIELKNFQMATYSFEVMPELWHLIQSVVVLPKSDLRALSLYLEPLPETTPAKPFPLLSQSERIAQGFFTSDAQWVEHFFGPTANAEWFAPLSSPMNLVTKIHHGSRVVVGGTWHKIIERVTLMENNKKLRRTVLTTFREFLTPPQFLVLLIKRWKVPTFVSSSGQAPSVMYENLVTRPIRKRIIDWIEDWINYHPVDFARFSSLDLALNTFIEFEISLSFPMKASMLRRALFLPLYLSGARVFPPPAGSVPLNSQINELSVFDFSPVDVARQLTLIDHQQILEISPNDFFSPADTESFSRCKDWKQKLRYSIIQEINTDLPAQLVHWFEVAKALEKIHNWRSLWIAQRALAAVLKKHTDLHESHIHIVRFVDRLGEIFSDRKLLRSRVGSSLSNDSAISPLNLVVHEIENITSGEFPESYLAISSATTSSGIVDLDRCSRLSEVLDSHITQVKERAAQFAPIQLIRLWLKNLVANHSHDFQQKSTDGAGLVDEFEAYDSIVRKRNMGISSITFDKFQRGGKKLARSTPTFNTNALGSNLTASPSETHTTASSSGALLAKKKRSGSFGSEYRTKASRAERGTSRRKLGGVRSLSPIHRRGSSHADTIVSPRSPRESDKEKKRRVRKVRRSVTRDEKRIQVKNKRDKDEEKSSRRSTDSIELEMELEAEKELEQKLKLAVQQRKPDD